MKKFFRIVVYVLINLVTLPVQIGILAVILTSNLTQDEWNELDDWADEACHRNKTWIKTGRFSK